MGRGVNFKRLQKASVFSVMADECTDITAVEELSVFCGWEEDGTSVEFFLDIVPLKKADAESIYLALAKCIKDRNLQVGNIVGMGVDGAATLSGKMTGWCSRKIKDAPHAIFVQSPPAISMCASYQYHNTSIPC